MERTRTHLLFVALAFAGCGAPPPSHEGFTLAVRFVSIDVAVIDELRLRFQPPAGSRFEPRPDATFEGGAIEVRVETDGSLVMEITGAHVRATAIDSMDGTQKIYELQVWSDDPTMDNGPLVLGSVSRSGEIIGDGTVFLPAWPPPTELDGSCSNASVGCRTSLGIACTAAAAMAGRCTP